jgi:hypothetical protein
VMLVGTEVIVANAVDAASSVTMTETTTRKRMPNAPFLPSFDGPCPDGSALPLDQPSVLCPITATAPLPYVRT